MVRKPFPPKGRRGASRAPRAAAEAPERLQKVLARAGLASRRQLEQWIAAGRISVNGRCAELGIQVTSKDVVRVDGRIVALIAAEDIRPRILLYHKPVGEVTTRREQAGRPTVFEALPPLARGRWLTIGRLDVNSCGLLLVTNDGELAHGLAHPSKGIEREYAVRVFGEVTETALATLRLGVELEDGPARFDRIVDAGGEGANHWYHVTLTEGRHREVRRLWESQGLKVSRLIRVRFGPVALPRDLRPGRWRPLGPAQLRELYGLAGLRVKQDTAGPKGNAGGPKRRRSR